jgi:hypothetical protein
MSVYDITRNLMQDITQDITIKYSGADPWQQ